MSKYARIERERRYLLVSLPDGLTEPRTIYDRYLEQGELRVRQVEWPDRIQYKLGHKPRLDAEHAMMTNIYLTEPDYRTLAALPGHDLRKRRYTAVWQGRRYCVDVFEGHLQGLVLAEVEMGEGDDPPLPPFAVADVTTRVEFTGGRLAEAETPPHRTKS